MKVYINSRKYTSIIENTPTLHHTHKFMITNINPSPRSSILEKIHTSIFHPFEAFLLSTAQFPKPLPAWAMQLPSEKDQGSFSITPKLEFAGVWRVNSFDRTFTIYPVQFPCKSLAQVTTSLRLEGPSNGSL